jgi:hypothetical protein
MFEMQRIQQWGEQAFWEEEMELFVRAAAE